MSRARTAWLRRLLLLLLIAWAAGLVAAGWQLRTWRQDISAVLVQVRADHLLRASLRGTDQMDPGWYRVKAVALLQAMERLRHSGSWTLFIPGSWRVFDDLEQRVAARLSQEFGAIVVHAVRRELEARGAQLAGARLDARTGMLDTGAGCAGPAIDGQPTVQTVAVQHSAEYAALERWIAQAQQLDAAVGSFLRWQQDRTPEPDATRALLRYALGVEVGPLPRPLLRAIAGAPPAPPGARTDPFAARLQFAFHCAARRGVEALHARLLAGNALLAGEDALAAFGANPFDAALAAPGDGGVAQLRQVSALLSNQQALLAQGGTGWMREDRLRLGPGHERQLERLAEMQMVGPELVAALRRQGETAFAGLQRRLRVHQARPGGGLVARALRQDLAFSPERAALHQGLAALLREPALDAADPALQRAAWGAGSIAQEADALARERRRITREVLPQLPPSVRRSAARFVEARLSAPLTQRLDRIDQELRGVFPFSPAPVDWRAWTGEGSPLQALLGGDDAGRLAQLAAHFERIAQVGQEIAPPPDAPMLAEQPVLRRWEWLRAELPRYRARQPDSSLWSLEQYLQSLATVRRDNCLTQLAQVPPPVERDEVGRQHARLHRGLQERCVQLRSAALSG